MYATWRAWRQVHTCETVTAFYAINLSITSKSFLLPSYWLIDWLIDWEKEESLYFIFSFFKIDNFLLKYSLLIYYY